MTSFYFLVKVVSRFSETTDIIDVLAKTSEEAITKMKKKLSRRYGDISVSKQYMTCVGGNSELAYLPSTLVRIGSYDKGIWIQ